MGTDGAGSERRARTEGVSTERGRWKARGLAHHEQKLLDDESEKKNQKSFFTTWQPEIRQSRQTAKRSYPPSNPICHDYGDDYDLILLLTHPPFVIPFPLRTYDSY